MGVYERSIVPRLLDLAMRSKLLDHYRQRTIETARDLVLEVGVGSGLNLPLYGSAVIRVVAVDPSQELLRLASERVANALVPVSLIRASAAHLPFSGSAFDTIVMTWTLCSIPNPMAALTEMRRVLRPGGRLIFVEHGLSPEIRTARWQHRLTPYWKHFSGGCHLDRKTDDLIRAAGFQISAVQTGYIQGPKPRTYMFQGPARSCRLYEKLCAAFLSSGQNDIRQRRAP
jgi:SAM-dependent methyltransferase